ncbi:serine hydrolase [Candidatus Saccharibacteria bacterium]|nr:serine hydrolase [Candidatus Saccharibacteria bacterium]MCA9884450.1 serine hydrolase [Anaerolineae bacterium]
MKKYTRSLFAVSLIVLLLSTTLQVAGEDMYYPTTDWQTSTPEEQGMDSAELAGFFEMFSDKYFNMDSLMMIRNGYVVAEAYTPPFNAGMKHHLYSSSKSVTSALIGILLQEGYLDNLDTTVLSLFPDRTVQNIDANKEAMTVRHLLTMSSGFACDDMATGNQSLHNMMNSDDWLQYALDMPMGSEPGTEFHYCNPVTYILSAIINEKTGMSALDYAAEMLFAPLGISDYAWSSSPQGVSYGFSDLQLTPRDMAKFGYLYLRGGEWDGTQIIPAHFVQASIVGQIETGWPDTGYGYQWWYVPSIGTASTLGWGGQYIDIDPQNDRIAVLTGGFTENIRPMLQGYPFFYSTVALSAGDQALPENPEAQRQLDDVIAGIEEPEPVVVEAMPDIALQVTNQNYTLFGPMPIEVRGALGEVSAVHPVSLSFEFSDNSQQANLTFMLDTGEEWLLPMSLNGICEVSEGPIGPVGAFGEWETNEQFSVFIKYIGDAKLQRFIINFMPNEVNILASEYTGSTTYAVQGVVMGG